MPLSHPAVLYAPVFSDRPEIQFCSFEKQGPLAFIVAVDHDGLFMGHTGIGAGTIYVDNIRPE
jgi:hypothetical protein